MKNEVQSRFLLTLSICLALGGTARAASTCVNKNSGAVRFLVKPNAACKKTEEPIQIDTGGSGSLAGQVTDAKGDEVGIYMASEQSALIDTPVGFWQVPVTSAGFVDGGWMNGYYVAPNCQGEPLLFANTSGKLSQGLAGSGEVREGVLYYPALPSGTEVTTYQSVASPISPNSCQNETGSAVLVPIASFPLSSLGFTAPFQLN